MWTVLNNSTEKLRMYDYLEVESGEVEAGAALAAVPGQKTPRLQALLNQRTDLSNLEKTPEY